MINFLGKSVAGNGSPLGSASITINKPVPFELLTGDVLLVCMAIFACSGVTITAPPEWMLIRETQYPSYGRVYSAYKVIDGTEGESFKWTFSASRRAVGGIIAWRGCNKFNPINMSTGGTGLGTNLLAPSGITTKGSCWLVYHVIVNPVTSGQITPPTGMYERWESLQGAGYSSDGICEESDVLLESKGSTGDRVAICSTSGRYATQLIALEPSGGERSYLRENRWQRLAPKLTV